MNFEDALKKVLIRQGQYSNDKDDIGGETYYGVSRKYHPTWKGWPYVDAKDWDNPTLQKLVEDFYKTNFWEPLKLDLFPEIASYVFDTAVNIGMKRAAIMMQTAISFFVPIATDGKIGPITIGTYAVLATDSQKITILKALLVKLRVDYYLGVVLKNPTQKKFFFGWVRRACDE